MSFKLKSSSDSKYQQQAKYAPAKRKTAKWQWYLLVMLIASPLIYFAVNLISELFIPKAEGLITFEKIEIKAHANLYIDKIFVKNGEKVKKGQLLIKLDDPQNNTEYSFINNEITLLEKQKASEKNNELENLEKMKKESEIYIAEQLSTYEKLKDLRKRGLSTIQELQISRYYLDLGRIQLHEVEMKISESNEKFRLFIENVYDSKIRKLKLEARKIKSILDKSNIIAPEEGTVVEIFANNRELAQTGKNLLTIATDENMHVIAYLQSRFLKKGIHKGTEVKVSFHDGYTVNGLINRIKKQAEINPNLNNFIKEEKNRIVLLIKVKNDLPQKYKIYGLPVVVNFDLLKYFF